MPYHFFSGSDFITTLWSGGSTKQLFIRPPEASFAGRQFDFRLSTATVEAEKSDFTPLPGFSRKLMILKGSIEIAHQNHHSKSMLPFDVDCFEGDWQTTSRGFCTDFNVISAPGFRTNLYQKKIVQSAERLKFALANWVFLFCVEGFAQISVGEASFCLKSGDLLLIEGSSISSCSLEVDENCTLVVTEISRDN
jgi:uncharacterized protein